MSEKTKRMNYIKQSGVKGVAGWAVLLLFLIKMVYMSYKNGMLGMSFYAYASVIFYTIYILFGLAVVPVLKKMIFFQINRGSYRNAAKVFRVIAGFMITASCIISAVIFIFSTKISIALFNTSLCSLLIKFTAVALLIWIPSFCLKGYMEGIGNAMPGIFADVMAHTIGLLITILFQPAFAEYGRKVAALVRQDSYAYAYAACSGGLGLFVGGGISLIFLLFVKSFFGREIKKRIHNDEMKKTDSAQDILWNFFAGYAKNAFTENIGVLLAIVLFVLYANMSGKAENGAGMLYTGIAVMILPAGLLAWQISVPFKKQLTSIMKQSDFHHAKERMTFYLKLLSYSIFPYSAATFALAPAVAKALYDVQNPDFEALIRIGAITCALLCLGIFFRQAVSVLLKPYLRNIYTLVLGISGIIFFFVLRRAGTDCEKSAAYAYMLACLVYLLIAAFVVLKKIRIHNRLLQSVISPLVSAVFGAAVAFGIFMILSGKIQAWLGLVLYGILVYVMHNILIAVLQVFEAHEWSDVPLCGFPVSFAKLTGKY